MFEKNNFEEMMKIADKDTVNNIFNKSINNFQLFGFHSRFNCNHWFNKFNIFHIRKHILNQTASSRSPSAVFNNSNLSVFKIPAGFELAVTCLKTNYDEIMNGLLWGKAG